MSYFVVAARRFKKPLLLWGISGTTGYSIETRLFNVSESSDRCTTGCALGVTSFGGWGRENMSLNTGDDAASTDLLIWKSTESDDRRMISPLGISEYFGGEVAARFGVNELPQCLDLPFTTGSDKCDTAC